MNSSILSVLLLITTPAPLTLGEALRLPPSEAGDRALAGLPHGPIVTLDREPDRMKPPGTVEIRMRETPQAISLGCVRNGWMVTFRHGDTTPEHEATLSSAYPQPEVILNRSADCPANGYAKVGTKLSGPLALAALQTLDDVVRRKTKRKIVCKNETQTVLCESTKTTLQELSIIRPWMVTNQSGAVEIWLGTPGQMITIVSFDKTTDGALRITRKIPAPF